MGVQTELEWLLEDNVGGHQALKALSTHAKQQAQANERAAQLIPLRLSIDQLDALWARRFADRHDGPLHYGTMWWA